jgi:hypothetical protein
MGIDSEAEKDLALRGEDAENVAGGREVAKKKKIATVKHGRPVTSYTVSAPPLQGDPGVQPGMSEAELESDPDC